MFDMNLHQLQYVADNLSDKQCRQLSEALSMNGMILDHPVSGVDEKDLSCLRLLLLYDRSDKGRAKSFVDVAIRLRQIGRPDVAEQLSDMVYQEKANQVQKAILDNPFKNQIETESPLLVKPPRPGTSGQQEVRKQEINRVQLIGIVGGSLILIVLIVYCCGRRTEWKLCIGCKNYMEDVYKIARHPMVAMHSGREDTQTTTTTTSRLRRQRSNTTDKSRRSADARTSHHAMMTSPVRNTSSIVTLSAAAAADSPTDSDESAGISLL